MKPHPPQDLLRGCPDLGHDLDKVALGDVVNDMVAGLVGAVADQVQSALRVDPAVLAGHDLCTKYCYHNDMYHSKTFNVWYAFKEV